MSPKVFIVTGASKGIGAAIAQTLLSQSHKVVIAARTQGPLEAFKKAHPDQVEYVTGDLTDATVVKKIVDVAVKAFGRIDGLIINHGLHALKKLADLSMEEFQQTYNVNVFSYLSMAKAALPELRKSNGTVIWISSGAAALTFAAWGPYSSSKAAVNILSTHLAAEEPDIVSVSIEPGLCDTDLQASIRSEGRNSMSEAEHEFFTTTFNSGGLLKPEQPAHVIAGVVEEPSKDLSGKTLSWNSPELSAYQE